MVCDNSLVISLRLPSQAANLFERTVKGIARCVVAAPSPDARLTAQKALLALLVSLDAWAGPLKVGQCQALDEIKTAMWHPMHTC